MITQGRTSSPPTREAERWLGKRLTQFDLWAITADRTEDGWESDFPEWRELMQEAEQVMAAGTQDSSSLLLLGRCWAISEEDETCADWAREHMKESPVRAMVCRLAFCADPRTRWQACAVLGSYFPLDGEAVRVLENCFTDEDSYVRRRAFLALENHGGIDRQPYLRQMLSDEDAYNRYVAVRQAGGHDNGDGPLADRVQTAALDPAVTSLLAADEIHEDAPYRPLT